MYLPGYIFVTVYAEPMAQFINHMKTIEGRDWKPARQVKYVVLCTVAREQAKHLKSNGWKDMRAHGMFPSCAYAVGELSHYVNGYLGYRYGWAFKNVHVLRQRLPIPSPRKGFAGNYSMFF